MQEATITRTLLALRAQIIRDNQPGLEHVEALLQLRGNKLPPVPRKIRQPFKRNECSRAVLAMLRDGPQPFSAIVARLVDLKGMDPLRAKMPGASTLSFSCSVTSTSSASTAFVPQPQRLGGS